MAGELCVLSVYVLGVSVSCVEEGIGDEKEITHWHWRRGVNPLVERHKNFI